MFVVVFAIAFLSFEFSSIGLYIYYSRKKRHIGKERELAEHYKLPGVNFFVIESSTNQIFTIHGIVFSTIIISSALLERIRSELLDVLIYHEYGHVYFRHYERRILVEASFLFLMLVAYEFSNLIILPLLISIIFAFFFDSLKLNFEKEADYYAVHKVGRTGPLKLLLIASDDDSHYVSERLKNISKI
jgi:Zn-dependent protease with chaperone function